MTDDARRAWADWAVPPGLEPPKAGSDDADRRRCASWSPEALETVAIHLAAAGPAALRETGPDRLVAGWLRAVATMETRGVTASDDLLALVAKCTGLSELGLRAALGIMLAGVDRRSAPVLVDRARRRPRQAGLTVAILASNVPALAVQAVLPALALGRPVLVKLPRAEPFWTTAFLRALTAAEPALAPAVAAACWPGGDRAIEDRVFRHADAVVAYGDGVTIDDLSSRLGPRLHAFGPKFSVALIGGETDPQSIADGLARDIALFDQRGCLSVQAVYTAGDAIALADALAAALGRVADDLLPGPIEPACAAAVQRLRTTAAMRGHHLADLPLYAGTVMVEPDPTLRPSPGARTVRIHPVDELDRALASIEPHKNQLQGAALAGASAWALEPRLADLGVCRLADPGHLQDVDLSWQNGGVSLLDVLSA